MCAFSDFFTIKFNKGGGVKTRLTVFQYKDHNMTLISQPYSLSLFLMMIKRGMEVDRPAWFASIRNTAREIGTATKNIEPLRPDMVPMQDY